MKSIVALGSLVVALALGSLWLTLDLAGAAGPNLPPVVPDKHGGRVDVVFFLDSATEDVRYFANRFPQTGNRFAIVSREGSVAFGKVDSVLNNQVTLDVTEVKAGSLYPLGKLPPVTYTLLRPGQVEECPFDCNIIAGP